MCTIVGQKGEKWNFFGFESRKIRKIQKNSKIQQQRSILNDGVST
jgi:hypothetical protein